MNLTERWQALWSELSLSEPRPQVLEKLLACYSEGQRSYHNIQHLNECFAWFDRGRHLAFNPAAVHLALWFHDAIHDPRNERNEEESAEWAVQVLQEVGGTTALQDSVQFMILATRHNAQPMSGDARLVVDVDLSILGAPISRFQEYERQIREEYAWVPEPVFREKRAEILQRFLARPHIYAIEYFQDQLEKQARSNLQQSLAQLNAS